MPFRRKQPVRILPYFGYRSSSRLRISARALQSRKADFTSIGRWRAIRTMIAQFASHEVADLSVTLVLAAPDGEKHTHTATSDAEGFTHFDIELSDWDLPSRPTWEIAAFTWTDKGESQSVEGHVLTPGRQTKLGVISDIDDTIIETGITGNFRAVLRNWKRVMAQMPDERIAVPGVDSFYDALGGGAQPKGEGPELGEAMPTLSARPFFYVSSSPWNLYSYLVAFKQLRKLPLGPIALRDWGLNRETFGSSSHGSHKRDAIDLILQTYPHMRFALIGDDTQGDLTAYGLIVADYPERIAAVFIRTGGSAMSAEEHAAQDAIKNAGVPLWLGPDYATGQDFLRATGLDKDSGAKHIVTTINSVSKASDL